MQNDVVNFATSLLQIKAQIICNHFTEDTIIRISGANQLSDSDKPYIPDALALLKDEPAVNFRVEVTSDSMIYQDEQAEKQNRMEFLQSIGGFMQQVIPAAQSVPELTPMLMEMVKFAVTAYKAGKGLEGIIDETADKFRDQAKQAESQPKPPSPEQQKMEMEVQIEQQKMQLEVQLAQAKMQADQQQAQLDAQLEQQKISMQMELEKAKQEYQAQENRLKFELEDQRNMKESEMQMELEKLKSTTENNKAILVTYLDNATKLETARIGAGLDDGSAAYIESIEQARILQDQMGYSQMADHPLKPALDQMQESNAQLTQMLAILIDKMNQPKQVVRGPDGRIVGVQ